MFNEIIKTIVTLKKPSNLRTLETFKTEAEIRFQALLNLRVLITDKNDCLLVLKGETPKPASSLQEIEDLAVKLWDDLAYKHFQASECKPYKESIGFRFITIPSNEEYFVSGILLIKCPNYAFLADEYSQKYSILNSLSSLPEHWSQNEIFET